MASESNNGQSPKGFLGKMFGFLPKTRLTIGNTANTRQQLPGIFSLEGKCLQINSNLFCSMNIVTAACAVSGKLKVYR